MLTMVSLQPEISSSKAIQKARKRSYVQIDYMLTTILALSKT